MYNQFQTLTKISRLLKEFEGKSIKEIFEINFHIIKDCEIADNTKAKRDLTNFYKDDLDLFEANGENSGIWAALNLVQYRYSDITQAYFFNHPCEMVSRINYIRAKNAIDVFLQAYPEYSPISVADESMVHKFDKQIHHDTGNAYDIEFSDDLPF